MPPGGRGGRSAYPVTAGVTGRRVAVQCTGQRLAAGTVPGLEPVTWYRKQAVFHGVLGCTVELGLLPAKPRRPGALARTESR